MTRICRLTVVAAALLGAWGFGHLNGPVRLAGPFNLPDPWPVLAVVLALALAAIGARRSGWDARRFGMLLAAAAGLVIAAGAANLLGRSPDGGEWGDRYVQAEPAWTVALFAVAVAVGLIGTMLVQRARR